MDINISSQGFSAGENLKKYIEEHLRDSICKYFQNAVTGNVTISKEAKHRVFHVEIIVHEGVKHGPIIVGSAKGFDPYISAGEAIARIDTKLRRYKRKLKDHKLRNSTNLKYHLLSKHDDDQQEIKPKIIEEEKLDIKHLSIEGAIMHMEFLSLSTLIFINAETNKLNIIYEKEDGHIVLVDTSQILKNE